MCVQGDEDLAVGFGVPLDTAPGLEAPTLETRRWTRGLLNAERRRCLCDLPLEREVAIERLRVVVTHAYPGALQHYLRRTEEELSRAARASPREHLIVLGHTHRTGVWRVGKQIVVMPGSVGQSTRGGYAEYALVEARVVTLHANRYDVGKTISDIVSMPWSPRAIDDCVNAIRVGTQRPFTRVPIEHARALVAVGHG